ncbi:hypothetical protein [Enterococcus crotali]|uniref:hypothetical protein n=1 Tax=Enterococcus crotali TaxID=1453587 RepID=UPI001EF9CF40|nr:hypothetical protein [Enterococcus crotali]
MMDKKIIDKIKNERKIPDEVLTKLESNRENILNKKIKQEKNFGVFSRNNIIAVLVAAIALLLIVTKTPVGVAIENVLGIGRDSGVETVEKNAIPTELNLTSIQNNREIKLTKFVSTRKKFAFDYQFKVDDEKLKTLLGKDMVAKSDHQDIQMGLFVKGDTKDLFQGVHSYSTFRLDGDVFYGSVISTFDTESIPENAELNLHIYRLAWMDRDEYEVAESKAFADPDNPQPFSVPTSLEYTGDWSFDIAYRPLNQTAVTKVLDSNNVTNIVSKSDALQTTITFNAPIEYPNSPEITVYKNDIEISNSNINFKQLDQEELEIELDLSALDKISTYKVKIEESDIYGTIVKEVGFFEVQNK